jgi:glycosyltransferase involved in cell wall biosynthesis
MVSSHLRMKTTAAVQADILMTALRPAISTALPARRLDAGLRVLILNGDFPAFPSAAGHEYLNTRNLAERAGRVGLVSMVHDADSAAKARRFSQENLEVYLWENANPAAPPAPPHPAWIRRLHAAPATLQGIDLGPRLPRDARDAALAFRNMAGPLGRALGDRAWDVFVVIQSAAAAAIDRIPEPSVKVLVMHDIRALALQRQASVARSPRERLWLRREARRFFRFEHHYAQRYDLLIALSEHDAAWIRTHYAPKAVAVAPIPVDIAHFSPNPSIAAVPGRIVFTGLMNHSPNVDAAAYFAREVFPRIRAARPKSEFFIVGKRPAPGIEALRTIEGVTVTGEVPDTRAFLAGADVVVVPLRYGSGVRNKILEAWAMEKCVVSTTIGAEGLEYEAGRDLLIGNGAGEFAAEVLRALDDAELRQRLGVSGRDIAATHHNPDLTAHTYYTALSTTATARRSPSSAPMRVAVDMRWIVPGRSGGIEHQARAFLSSLLEFDSFNQYRLILPSALRYEFDRRGASNVRIHCPDAMRATAGDIFWKAAAALHGALRVDYWQSAEVRNLRKAREFESEIAYSFTGFIHPQLYALRNVLMVPDIQHEYHPEFFTDEAVEERKRIYTESILRADHLCPASDFTRRTLIEKFGIDPDRITTIPLAADPIFTAGGDAAQDAELVARLGLAPRRYLFFPGNTWKHKNHRTAVEALRILRDRYGMNLQLVCTGCACEAQEDLESRIERRKLRDHVRFLGYRPRNEMPSLYRCSAALIFPSMFEGFGMPVVEAMACGTPVICGDRTSLPETAGGAAILVDPEDAEGFARAIDRVLHDAALRQDLIRRGFEQAGRFSWRRHTLDTIQVLRRVHEQLHGAGARP